MRVDRIHLRHFRMGAIEVHPRRVSRDVERLPRVEVARVRTRSDQKGRIEFDVAQVTVDLVVNDPHAVHVIDR